MKNGMLLLVFTLFLAMSSTVRALIDRLISENNVMVSPKILIASHVKDFLYVDVH